MLNLLENYICASLPEVSAEGKKALRAFQTHPNLEQKVAKNASFLPFYGNTTVFVLDKQTEEALQLLQEKLYRSAGWMLSERLEPSTFHMTLHDLVNGPEMTGDLRCRMEEAEIRAKAILRRWQEHPPLKMKATWLFNMMNTSIVLGLKPADESSWEQLDAMYLSLEEAVPLNRPLTPHITMAYFRPGCYTAYDLSRLRQALQPVELEMELPIKNLVFQNFYHMNGYTALDLPIVGRHDSQGA